MSDFDLDGLLEESVDLVKKTKELRKQQKSAKQGRPAVPNMSVHGFMSREEYQEHVEDVKKFKVRAEGWICTEVVLLAHCQVCSHCGTEHFHIEGTFIKKWNEKLRITNLVKPDGAYEMEGLQKKVEIRTASVAICMACHTQQGWDNATEEIL